MFSEVEKTAEMHMPGIRIKEILSIHKGGYDYVSTKHF